MKSKAQYEELFEDLMEYTKFTSSDEIKTKDDLARFFEQVVSHSSKKGKFFRVSKKMFSKMKEAIIKPEPILRKVERAKASRGFKSFEEAKSRDLVVMAANILIYKSSFKVKGKIQIRWRNEKGRFAKTPE